MFALGEAASAAAARPPFASAVGRILVVAVAHGLLLLLSLSSAAAARDSARRGGAEAEAAVERSADDNIVSTIRQLSTTLNKCGVDTRPLSQMRRIMLAGEAKCMDGSPIGYYIRKSPGRSRKWLVFLEGGSYCYDNATCNSRLVNSPNLTSSIRWSPALEGRGILSADAEENPFLFFANVVFVPYCSSDGWTGTVTKGNHLFMGSHIIDEVMVDLLNHGLRDANKLFLTGSSAGGTGVLLNLDRVTALLAERAPGVNVLGIVDSGWFVDVPPLRKVKCTNVIQCAPAESMKRGSRYWKARIPHACEQEYRHEPWRCFFGYRLYPFIKTPVFIIQFLFDAAQVLTNMGHSGLSHIEQMPYGSQRDQQESERYLQGLGQKINRTLHEVAAVFAPACLAHEILLKSFWYRLAINGISLHDALKCWEESQQATNRVRPSSRDSSNTRAVSPDRRLPSGRGGNAGTTGSGRNNSPRHSTRKASRPPTRSSTTVHSNRQPRDARPRSADGSLAIKDTSATLKMAVAGSSEIDMLALTNQLIEYREQKKAQCSHRVMDSCEGAYCNFRCPNFLAMFGSAGGQQHSESLLPAGAALGAPASAAESWDFYSNNR